MTIQSCGQSLLIDRSGLYHISDNVPPTYCTHPHHTYICMKSCKQMQMDIIPALTYHLYVYQLMVNIEMLVRNDLSFFNIQVFQEEANLHQTIAEDVTYKKSQ